jgi:hypothetical protein
MNRISVPKIKITSNKIKISFKSIYTQPLGLHMSGCHIFAGINRFKGVVKNAGT